MGFLRGFLVFVSACCFVNAFGQQGQGGGGAGGGGFGGGGFQGNFSQREGEVYPRRSGSYIDDTEQWTPKAMILTQGDKVEWKVSGKKGQAVFATVISDVFDPALAIVDEHDKELAFNDDQKDGDQSPFLTFYFPGDGEYKIVVKNYRSSAGGKFTLFTRFVAPITLSNGSVQSKIDAPADFPSSNELLLRVHATSGQVFGVESPTSIDGGNSNRLEFNRVIGPTGVSGNDFSFRDFYGLHQIIEAKSTGDFYLGYRQYDDPAKRNTRVISSRLVFSEISKMPKFGSSKFHLEPHQFKIVTFPVEAGELIRTTSEGTGDWGDLIKGPILKVSKGLNAQDQESFRNIGFLFFNPQISRLRDSIRLFGASGDASIILFDQSEKPTDLTITNRNDFEELTKAMTFSKEVVLGQTHYFLVKGKRGDNLTLTATASGLEPELTFVNHAGSKYVLNDRTTHEVIIRFSLDKVTEYLVGVGAAGNGGSGAIHVKFQKQEPKLYVLGAIGTGDEKDEMANLFRLKLEVGQRYQIVMENCDRAPQVISEDGADLILANSNTFEKTHVYYYQPTATGEYRLRLLGATKDTRFKVDKYVLPKIGGG